MPYCTANDGTHLFYTDWGTGAPTVFLAGWALSSDTWAYQTVALVDEGIRCVAYDRRGQGRSDHPGHGYDFDTLADDLAALLAHLDLRDVTLVGHSIGAGEIARYLSRHGVERIARVVLIAPTTPCTLKTVDNPDGVEPAALEAQRAAWRKDFPRWLNELSGPYVGAGLPIPAISPELVQWQIRDMLRSSLQALIACNRTATETDFRADLAAITVPTLIIHGDADWSAPLERTGRKTAQLIPGAELVIYENAPHAIFLTHTERLNRDLLAFIAS